MYTPSPFRESRRETLLQFVERHPFATLVSTGSAGPIVSHVPLLLDRSEPGADALLGHVARANEHSALLQSETPTLAIFHGPHAYVSPSWLSAELSVPTWNYAVVHVQGTPSMVSPDETRAIVVRLTETYEHSSANPWAPELSSDFFERQLRAIVGFRLPISSIEGKFKLSQNKPEQERNSVIAGLAAQSNVASSQLAEFSRDYFAGIGDE